MRYTADNYRYYLKLATLAAERGTCARRRCGCVLVNRLGHILSTGYNGVPRRVPHCTEHPCAGASMPSGEGLDMCMATHAEQNALLQCRNVEDIHVCYVTSSPCITCVKLLMNTSCKEIVFAEEYPHPVARSMWLYGRPDVDGIGSEDLARSSLYYDRTWIHIDMSTWSQRDLKVST